jgi:isopropylmalate/homocitrate/citramalate synthase
MGHKGDIEAVYTLNKGITQDAIEKMREAYRKCERLLSTEKQASISEQNLKDALREQLLLIAGFKKEEVEKMDLSALTDEEIQQTIRQKLLGVMTNNGNRQKPIAVGELDDHLAKGWEFVPALPDDRILMRLPF